MEPVARRTVSRRVFLRAAGLAIAGAGLAACTPQAVATQTTDTSKEVTRTLTATPASVTIKIQQLGQDNRAYYDEYQWAIREFMESHPTITLQPEEAAFGGSYGEVAAYLAGGTAPDTFDHAINLGPQLGGKDLVYDVAPLSREMGIADKFIPAVWNGFAAAGGQVYALPKNVNTIALWCNPVVFEKAGVKDRLPVRNWDDMIAVCEAVKKLNRNPDKPEWWGFTRPATTTYAGFFFWFWLWRFFPGDPANPANNGFYDGSAMQFGQAYFKEAMDKLRYMIDRKYIPLEDDWEKEYYAGRVAFKEWGQWIIPGDVAGPWNNDKPTGAWMADYPRPVFEAAPLPELKAGIPGYSVFAGFASFIPRTNKHLPETMQWLWFKTSHKTYGTQSLRFEKQLLPLKPEVLTHEWLSRKPWSVFMQQLNTTRPLISRPEEGQALTDCFDKELVEATLGRKTVDAAIKAASTCGDDVIRNFKLGQ